MMMDDPKKVQILLTTWHLSAVLEWWKTNFSVAFLKLDRVRVTDEQYYAKCPLTNKSRTAIFIHASFLEILVVVDKLRWFIEIEFLI